MTITIDKLAAEHEAAKAEGLSRRMFLRSAPPALIVGATVSAPALAEAASPEAIGDRVSRLLKELTNALTEFGEGQFKAVVYPTMNPQGVTHLAHVRPLAAFAEGGAA